jgi:hypothetical protein
MHLGNLSAKTRLNYQMVTLIESKSERFIKAKGINIIGGNKK